jgi:hypothetical protein
MTKTIFLDIDGVLNGHEWCHIPDQYAPRVNPGPAQCFNSLINQTQANVVISSSWRHWVLKGYMTVEGFERMLKSHSVICHVIGTTCDNHKDEPPAPPHTEHPVNRAKQIKAYVNKNNLEKWIAIDDLPLFDNSRQIRTNPALGLQPYEVTRAVELLA